MFQSCQKIASPSYAHICLIFQSGHIHILQEDLSLASQFVQTFSMLLKDLSHISFHASWLMICQL